MSRTINLPSLLRRFDDQAHEQLCSEAARLAEENERLRAQLAFAEEAADSWRDDALRMMEAHCAATGAQPGITLSGSLVAVPMEVRA